MAINIIDNIQITGISVSVPKNKKDNLNDHFIPQEYGQKIVNNTGIRFRRVVEETTTTSDLCVKAAINLLENIKFDKDDIKYIVFVTQTPDYILPSTSPFIQSKLGLSEDVFCLDINQGCSGYVYGMSVVTSLLNSNINPKAKALLLVGDTISKLTNKKDLSTYPLFGDAGTATLLEKVESSSRVIFNSFSDGSGKETIIVEDGGFRNPIKGDSNIEKEDLNGYLRRRRDLYLNGMDVFSFGITKVPKSIKLFLKENDLLIEEIDYCVFHQANLFMNEKIRKKIKATKEQTLYSLYNFGNTSSATIPLTIVDNLKSKKIEKRLKLISCGFGVGLSWSVMYNELSSNVYLNYSEF